MHRLKCKIKDLQTIVLIVSVMIVLFSLGSYKRAEEGNMIEDYKLYINPEFQITLEYPSKWKPNTDYSPPRYEGKDGFFLIAARNGLSLDGVAENNAYHKLSPYGDNPTIKKVFINGREARLIVPSEDQPTCLLNQSGLIVQYPRSVKIKNEWYEYFVLWADKGHILKIAETICFID